MIRAEDPAVFLCRLCTLLPSTLAELITYAFTFAPWRTCPNILNYITLLIIVAFFRSTNCYVFYYVLLETTIRYSHTIFKERDYKRNYK